MNSLFPSEKITFDLPNASLAYFPHLFDLEKANLLYEKLYQEIPWQQDNITVFGKNHLQPRLTALFGNEGKPYSYSNIIMQPHPWNPILTYIKEEVEAHCNETFTSVLLNLYRDGRDSNGWHADNEKELGRNPIIASVSFGAERPFHLQHNLIKEAKQKIILEHGSLLLMKGETQHFGNTKFRKPSNQFHLELTLPFVLSNNYFYIFE